MVNTLGVLEIVIAAIVCVGCLMGVAAIALVTFLLVRRSNNS